MSEQNKTVELNDEELSRVTGGCTQNEDGTYNILKGEFFSYGSELFSVLDNNYNVGLDTLIRVEYFLEGPDGRLKDYYITTQTAGMLLYYGGYISEYFNGCDK